MTLIETVVWIAVLVFATLGLVSSLLYFYRTNKYTFQEEQTISTAQHAMDAIVKALRTTSYSNSGAYPVISIAPNQVSFYANVIPNDPLIQQVRFFVTGTSLQEGIIEPSGNPLTYTPASEVVTDLGDYVLDLALSTSTFFYYDQNGSVINNFTQYQNVRYVTVNMIVDVATTSLPTQLTLLSSAALRNLIVH